MFKRNPTSKIISFAENKYKEAIPVNSNKFQLWFSFTTFRYDSMF